MAEQKIRFFGDFTTGENYQLKYEIEQRKNCLRQKGYDFLMDGLKEFFDEKTYNIINLESPITNCTQSNLEGKKALLHWMDYDIAPSFLKKYNVCAASLGNNHAYDWGHKGLVQTIQALNSVNIKPFGAGVDIKSANVPLIKNFQVGNKTVNLYVFGGYKYKENYEKEFDFYAKENKSGVFQLTDESIKNDILRIKQEDINSYVVVFPHFGIDFQKTLKAQRQYAKSWIDSGADLVIGHGAHMMLNIEYYKEKTICYSLGNSLLPVYCRNLGIPYNLIFELTFTDENNNLKIKQKLYPIYMDMASYAPITRAIKENELDDVIKYLCEGNEEVKERIFINKGRTICIEI